MSASNWFADYERERKAKEAALARVSELEKERTEVEAAVTWWFGGLMMSRTEGRVTHRLARTRHEGWICVQGVAGETFFGYMKRGAKTYPSAISALLAAYRAHTEARP